jgi:hypothetical protein
MRGRCGRFGIIPGYFRHITIVVVSVVLAGFLTINFAPPAHALPSFARQTGQP